MRYRGRGERLPPDAETAEPQPVREVPTWTPPPKPSFNSPAADLNQLRNEAKRIAESAPGQAVHKASSTAPAPWPPPSSTTSDCRPTSEGLSYADLAVLLSQSK